MAGTKFIQVLLVLAALPERPWAADSHGTAGCLASPGEAHSLLLQFNITFNGQPRCTVEGQIDGKCYLIYDCFRDEVTFMNLLKEEVKNTSDWEEHTSTLSDVGDFLTEKLSDVNPEKYKSKVPVTLQVRLMCQCKANGRTSASWEFVSEGKRVLVFDSGSRKYTEHSGGERMKEKWENDKEVTKVFTVTSEGDGNKWLKFLVRWKKEQETAATATTAIVTATSATASNTATPTIASSQSKTIVILVVTFIIIMIISGILAWLCIKRRRCSQAPESVV
ncbi:UL16-binding protein 3-like [Saccopteryx bilineata]|uniref:UL16-binding protein 3-like n=1 Tax=Saccopteryx bilineata TaxID=59482 RepID=UPI00338D4856